MVKVKDGEVYMSDEDELYWFIDALNDDDMPDGAWWALLEEGAKNFNNEYGTDYDPFECVHGYLRAKHPESENAQHAEEDKKAEAAYLDGVPHEQFDEG